MVDNSTPKEVIQLIKIRGFANTLETSIYLNLSIHYIRRLAREKELPSYKPNGKCIYFKIQDLDEFILSNKRTSKDDITKKTTKYLFNNR